MDKQKIKSHYDILIVGGGIVGAGIVRDLALHNQDVLLIEKGDYSSQTSQGSSKMLHGGIRYLENFDFLLVHEALQEKKIWLELSSHIAEERTFYLPVYKHSKWPLFFLRIGLFIYDLLSLFKNKPYRILTKDQTLKELPGLSSKDLKGAGQYSDGIIDDSKLVFDLLFDARDKGAQILNYHEIISLDDFSEKTKVKIQNTLTKENIEITCKKVIFAVGPFTDNVMKQLNIPWNDIILPSKGSHLWLKEGSLPIDEAMVLQTKDNRIIFVIPQRNSILVGTTEVPLNENEQMFNIKVSQEEIDYLINNLNNYFPNANLTESQVIATYSAVRPLVKSSLSKSRGKTSRKHKIYSPSKNIYVIAGGKYTTFRVMAQDVCKKVLKSINVKYNKLLSRSPFEVKSILAGADNYTPNKEELIEIIKKEQPQSIEDLILRRLSLYSIEQAKDPEKLKELIEEVKNELPSV